MRRSKKISAKDDSVKVTITIQIDAKPHHWVRQEVNSMTENLASAIMEQIQAERYLGMPLSKIKVQ